MAPGSLSQDFSIATRYPNARQYLQRYFATAASARKEADHVTPLGRAEAIELLREPGFTEARGSVVDAHTKFLKGWKEAISRTDISSGHTDFGALPSISAQESVIVAGKEGGLRLYCPSLSFAITVAE